MTQFDVFVQGKFYKTVSAKNTGDALALVARDIQKGLVSGFDSSKSHNVKVVRKVGENAFDNLDKNKDGNISREEFNA